MTNLELYEENPILRNAFNAGIFEASLVLVDILAARDPELLGELDAAIKEKLVHGSAE
jgi:hypothetical protein